MNPMLAAAFSSANRNPSPDEMVIQARGRRQIPLTFSPDVHTTPIRQQQNQRQRSNLIGSSASKSQGMTRLLLPTRSSPRKRLTLHDSPPRTNNETPSAVFQTPSPDKKEKRSPIAKKIRMNDERSTLESPGQESDLETKMKGLSQSQLINLFSVLMEKRPEVQTDLEKIIPDPDLAPLEENLSYLKRNIFRALPNTRLESKTDSLAYNRVSTHLLAFKKAVLDQGKTLTESEHWASVVDYTIMAWGYVKATPVWDNSPHNNIRKHCFKALAANCLQAIKKGSWNKDLAINIRDK